MKRSEALAPLSRQHHRGLAAALKLKRAQASDAGEARAAFLEFWEAEGRDHFRIEEEILLPAYARHGEADHPAVVRVLVEHVDLRRRGQASQPRTSPRPGSCRTSANAWSATSVTRSVCSFR
jgi:hypothetical protein